MTVGAESESRKRRKGHQAMINSREEEKCGISTSYNRARFSFLTVLSVF